MKQRVTITLDPELKRNIQRELFEEGKKLSSLIELLLRDYLIKNKRKEEKIGKGEENGVSIFKKI